MYIISPGHHKTADKYWKEKLGSKPNGARTLGSAQAKYLAPVFERYYDMLITYCSAFEFEIPKGVKKIAVCWHQNFPWVDAFKQWQRVNIKFQGYEVDWFCNERKIVELINEGGGRAFYLPRFIDTHAMPKGKPKKIDHLWFGNQWGGFQGEFAEYKRTNKEPYWITHGSFGLGDKKIRDVSHEEALEIVSQAKEVWAIGISQLEAQYYGANIVSYRGDVLKYLDEKIAPEYLNRLLNKIWTERDPSLGK